MKYIQHGRQGRQMVVSSGDVINPVTSWKCNLFAYELSVLKYISFLKHTCTSIIHLIIIRQPCCCCSCPAWQKLLEIHSHLHHHRPQWRRRGEEERRQREYLPWRKLLALLATRRRTQHLPSRRITILLNCQTLKKLPSISAKAPLRILCHRWSPIHGEMLFAWLGMHFCLASNYGTNSSPVVCENCIPQNWPSMQLTIDPRSCIKMRDNMIGAEELTEISSYQTLSSDKN